MEWCLSSHGLSLANSTAPETVIRSYQGLLDSRPPNRSWSPGTCARCLSSFYSPCYCLISRPFLHPNLDDVALPFFCIRCSTSFVIIKNPISSSRIRESCAISMTRVMYYCSTRSPMNSATILILYYIIRSVFENSQITTTSSSS